MLNNKSLILLGLRKDSGIGEGRGLLWSFARLAEGPKASFCLPVAGAVASRPSSTAGRNPPGVPGQTLLNLPTLAGCTRALPGPHPLAVGDSVPPAGSMPLARGRG